jgi:hypothetical protein
MESTGGIYIMRHRFKILIESLAALVCVYLASFFVYRYWAYATENQRPNYGVPAWYFVYPTQNATERVAYWAFYPCIRIDWRIQDAKDLG